MAAVGITAVKNAVVALIQAAWNPDDPTDEVIGRSAFSIDASKHTGRKVYVFRSAEGGEPATRGEDQNDYSLILLVVEKYTPTGDPPEEWIDERVGWCEWLLDTIGNPRTVRILTEPGVPNSGLWPELAEIAVVLDVEEITDRKLFVSQLNVTYREQE